MRCKACSLPWIRDVTRPASSPNTSSPSIGAFVGLTGTAAQIALAAGSFHVFYERHDTDDGGYLLDHSSFIYFVDGAGKFAKALTSEGGSKQIADTLSVLINSGR